VKYNAQVFEVVVEVLWGRECLSQDLPATRRKGGGAVISNSVSTTNDGFGVWRLW
jgi:hypothetical protein